MEKSELHPSVCYRCYWNISLQRLCRALDEHFLGKQSVEAELHT